MPPILPAISTKLERATAALIALATLAVLTTAAGLSPDSQGHGTHEQLGMPPCGWLAVTGKPCPTCGMTTAYAHAANTDFLTSAQTQPMGLVLAIATAVLFWGALHVLITGSRLGPALAHMLTTKALWITAGLVAAAWAYKMATMPTPA